MSTEVREMFSDIAPTYDRVNDVLSLGIHRGWRRKAVKLGAISPGDRVLDCATGTGDFAIELKRVVGPEGHVTGTDFCPDMLKPAPAKAEAAGLEVEFQQADVLDLPFADDSYDAATIAFGIRNVDDPVRGLSEMGRVVRPGGRVIVLEFGQPTGLFGLGYRIYSRYVMPFLGGLLSGNFNAYRYLPRTAAAFPAGTAFLELMNESRVFSDTKAWPLFRGIAYVYVGTVADHRGSPAS